VRSRYRPPNICDLRIDYNALSLAAPQKVRFRFNLDGQDPDWREIVNERTVHYSNLDPGEYRFRVVASNNSGVGDEQRAAVAFVIRPAFYQTNAFRVLSMLLVVGLLWAAWQLRTAAVEREWRSRSARELPNARGSRGICTTPCFRTSRDCFCCSNRH
jgi:hypothetical protein